MDTVWRMLSTTSHEFVEGSTTWSQLAGVPMNDLANTTLEDQTRHQWLWSAAELDSLGWAVGDTAWRMSLPRAGNLGASSVDRATLRVRWTATTALGGIVTDKNIRVAGDEFTQDIEEYMRRQHNRPQQPTKQCQRIESRVLHTHGNARRITNASHFTRRAPPPNRAVDAIFCAVEKKPDIR